MALTLHDVRCDPIAERALTRLSQDYTVAEEKSGLVLTKKSGDMQLFLYELDDLHQWEFVQNRIVARQSERLRVLLATVRQQRESWKIRALMAEAQALEATTRIENDDSRQTDSNSRYVSLKRYLAKQFHPDYAPGKGIEKIVRSEIFKEIWGEIERLDEEFSAARVVGIPTAPN